MPNGHRDAYGHDGGLSNPPSEAHTRDSETTASEKHAYHIARARALARQPELGRPLPIIHPHPNIPEGGLVVRSAVDDRDMSVAGPGPIQLGRPLALGEPEQLRKAKSCDFVSAARKSMMDIFAHFIWSGLAINSEIRERVDDGGVDNAPFPGFQPLRVSEPLPSLPVIWGDVRWHWMDTVCVHCNHQVIGLPLAADSEIAWADTWRMVTTVWCVHCGWAVAMQGLYRPVLPPEMIERVRFIDRGIGGVASIISRPTECPAVEGSNFLQYWGSGLLLCESSLTS